MMHPNLRRIIPIVIVLAVLLALAYWYFVLRPVENGSGVLSASGTIEITQVQVGPELGGKVAEVRVAEGDMVKAGDTLVQIDSTLLKAQRAQAAAALEVAKANSDAAKFNADAAQATVDASQGAVDAAQASLDLLQAGASQEQLTAAQAQLAQAEANRQAAEASFAALTAGALPQDVSTAHMRLNLARQEYYSMTVVLALDQVKDVMTAHTTAQANLEQAQSRLNDLKKDSAIPPEALAAASATENGASGADQAAQSALTAVQNSSLPFYQQLEAVQQSWNVAQLNLNQAKARQTDLLTITDLPQKAKDAASADVDDAQKLVDDAKAAYDGLNTSPQGDRLRAAWNDAQTALNDLNRLGRGASTTVETALNQLDAASALQDVASANLSSTQNGARSQQISSAQAQLTTTKAQLEAAKARNDAAQSQAAAAKAQVDMAQAALDILDVQINKLTITAPADGVVMTLIVQPGEIAAPSATLLILGRVDDKTITVYIPEELYGRISIGEAADVSVDSFPSESFQAHVVHIADKAEFTPRNVQTVEGRKNTVFAIKLKVEDPSGKLKAGMPADVIFK